MNSSHKNSILKSIFFSPRKDFHVWKIIIRLPDVKRTFFPSYSWINLANNQKYPNFHAYIFGVGIAW